MRPSTSSKKTTSGFSAFLASIERNSFTPRNPSAGASGADAGLRAISPNTGCPSKSVRIRSTILAIPSCGSGYACTLSTVK